MSLSRAIVFIAIFLGGPPVAVAQQPGTVPPVAPICDTNTRDSVGCPATTTVPGTSIDGNVTTVPSATSTGLFRGAVPPNGFMIRVYNASRTSSSYLNSGGCFVNDNGPANNLGGGVYLVPDFGGLSGTFITPPGLADGGR